MSPLVTELTLSSTERVDVALCVKTLAGHRTSSSVDVGFFLSSSVVVNPRDVHTVAHPSLLNSVSVALRAVSRVISVHSVMLF